MPSNVKLLAGASGGEPTDANFKNVTLLLHGDGSNGAQNNTFTDSSTNNFTITRNGNTTQGSFSPYGSNWSNYFDGSGDYLSYNEAAGDLGSGDWTMECWVFCVATPSNYASLVNKNWVFGMNDGDFNWAVKHSDGYMSFAYVSGGITNVTTTIAPSVGVWKHYAVTRSGTTLRIYSDGVLNTTATLPSGLSFGTASTTSVFTGYNSRDGVYFNGYISNLRILIGTALYTGSTYTVPTAPLTAITNTSLLTCAYNRFRDGSTNNFTITRNGDVKVTNFAPFAPSSAYSTSANGGSGYFDGSGDYLSAPSNTALDCGTGDWTIECWTYISTRTNSYPLVFGNNRGSWTTDALALTNSNADNASYNDKFVFGWNNGGFSSPSAGTSQLLVSNATNDLNTWYHFAVVRNGTSIKMYRNGVEVASATISAGASFNWGYNGALVGGGNWDGAGSYYNGYISNLRLVKGTAVYTAAFTPPSSPVTAITNTSLLLNATNAAIFDNSMKNDLETVGNAQISTSVKKFGTGSIAFDGSGDYLAIPDSTELQMGTGIFTIEFWWYPVSLSGTQCLFEKGYTISRQLALITGNGDGLINVYTSSPTFTASTAVTANTWNHIALVRNSGTLTLYLNGTSVASASNSTNFANSAPVAIGANITGGGGAGAYPVNGYIDEFRITKGVARYTANFTAPTAPFPNK